MNFDWKRWKILDYVVFALFILTIVGVSLTYWKADMGDAVSQGLEQAGMTAEELAAAGIDVSALAAAAAAASGVDTGASGWKFDSVVFLFVVSLFAALLAAAKAFFPVNKPLANWYREGLGIMGLGGIMTLIAFLRIVVPPDGGHKVWDPGAGAYITLIVSLVMLGVGYLMWRDKTGAYGSSTMPKIPVTTRTSSAPGGAGRFCSNCGAPLQPSDTQCGNCGKPA
jgi:hypothetical protein